VGERDGEYLVVLGAAGARFATLAGDREVGHERDALLAAAAQEVVGVPAMGVDAVAVLHADHRGDGLGLGQVRGPDAGDTQLADQPGVAQLGQRAEMLGDRIGGVGAEIHQIEVIAAELAQVLLDLAAQLPGGGPGQPRTGRIAAPDRLWWR